MSNKWLALSVGFGVLAILAAALIFQELLLVDSCLDSGGSYDYARRACDHSMNRPFRPLVARNSIALVMFLAASLLSLVSFSRSKRSTVSGQRLK
jgi:hypothetical protein